ncbi:hypothetical protein HQQ80_07325 [Microbacteriaceae bacterium VKM Ac-2855]|nr:hypothetical protein [Microbacteriaceae bacterium VKM Ac-2855]
MPAEWSYSDNDCEVLLVGGTATVLDRERNRYYQTTVAKLPVEIREAVTPRISRVSPRAAVTFVVVVLALLLGNLAFSLANGTERPSGWLVAVLAVYLPVSVVIHETAHALALRAMGRSIDKVGVKLNYWVFPAFYVRINQSLLLNRNEKVIVHGAGVCINLAINLVLFACNAFVFHWADLEVALQFVVLTLAINAIPALKSDGYRMLLALAGVDELRGLLQNPCWVVAIKVVSTAYVLCYSIYMVSSLVMRFIA